MSLSGLCECACANLISKANLNLINRSDLFICLHVMFQLSFQNSKGQNSYRKFLGVRSELLLSIYQCPDADLLGNSFFMYVSLLHNMVRSHCVSCHS